MGRPRLARSCDPSLDLIGSLLLLPVIIVPIGATIAMARPKTYVIWDARGLDMSFYEGFDPEFILKKAHALFLITENLEPFRNLVAASDYPEIEINDKYVQTLWAELYFAEFHQFEAFLALILAVFQDLPHWVYLTTYTTEEIKTKAQSFLDGNYSALTNGRVDTLFDFLNVGIYFGGMATDDDKRANWNTSLDNIAWQMGWMARKYLNGLAAYNSYKHGLRVLAGASSLTFTPHDPAITAVVLDSDTSVRFLETEKLPDGQQGLRETTIQYNPLESKNHLQFMTDVLKTVKAVRLASLKGKTEAEAVTFDNLDRDQLNRDRKYRKFSITR